MKMHVENQIQEDLEVLQSDLKRLMGDFEDMIKVKSITGSQDKGQTAMVEETAERLGNMIQEAQVTLSHALEKLKLSGRQAKQSIKEHPVASLLTALGVGVVVGKLLSRREG